MNGIFIKSFSVHNLFGRYNYFFPNEKNNKLTDLNILYGENGLGKTTILNLIFHMLSASGENGHRTAISNIPFSKVEIKLSNNTTISATKGSNLLVGPVNFIFSNEDQNSSWFFSPNLKKTIDIEHIPFNLDIAEVPDDYKNEITNSINQRNFHNLLSSLNLKIYLLTADRILQGDSVEIDSEVADRSRSHRSLNDLVHNHRNLSVQKSMDLASRWLSRKIMEKSYAGERLRSNIYENVISKISITPYKTSSGITGNIAKKQHLIDQISNINNRGGKIKDFGFTPIEISNKIKSIVSESTGNKLSLIDNVLKPHLDEVEDKINRIEPFYTLVNHFVSTVNDFLRDKRIIYSIIHGLKIVSTEENDEEITPSMLSSGEKQIILMFCYILISRDSPNVFVIDEPEISLNIIWQRKLVNSLKSISNQDNTQIIFASHSMEILTKHMERVIELE